MTIVCVVELLEMLTYLLKLLNLIVFKVKVRVEDQELALKWGLINRIRITRPPKVSLTGIFVRRPLRKVSISGISLKFRKTRPT